MRSDYCWRSHAPSSPTWPCCASTAGLSAPDVRFGRPLRSAASLFASKWWTIGFVVAFVAWGLHVAALTMAPLSLVQAVIAGGIALLAIPAAMFGISLGWRELLGLALSAVGLAFLALTAVDHPTGGSEYSQTTMAAFQGGRDCDRHGVALLGRPRRGPPPGRAPAPTPRPDSLIGVSASPSRRWPRSCPVPRWRS